MSNDQDITTGAGSSPAAASPNSDRRAADRVAAQRARVSYDTSQTIKKAGVAATGAALAVLGVLAPTRSPNTFPQYIENGACSLAGGRSDGSPIRPDEAAANNLKNRIEVPEAGDIDSTVSIDDFLGADAKSDSKVLDSKKAATVTGYVDKIVTGGSETCNCQTSDSQYFDTHIYLSADDPTKRPPPPKGTSPTGHDMIVEITPRMRQIVKPGQDVWSTENLQKKFPRGTKVTVTGWQFYDREHEAQSFNLHAKPSNWRYSCWELHPVTAIDPADR